MKKSVLLLLFVLNTSMLFAQKSDTAKRWVGGVMIKSTDDIVGSISRIKDLSKFAALLNYSGLADTIKLKGPLTLFAPVNDALNNATGKFYDSLYKSNNKQLLAILLKCYIIRGSFTSKDLLKLIRKGKGSAELNAIDNTIITASINGNRNIVLTDMNGEQSVIAKFDIEQNNGILDLITAILFPLKPPG